jgi:hypothetical protein
VLRNGINTQIFPHNAALRLSFDDASAFHFAIYRRACAFSGEALCTDPLWTPFEWTTMRNRLYSFCSNQSGALSTKAVAALSKSKLMIHGMEVGAMLDPVWENSELKTSMAAKQLRKVNPD